MDMATMDLVWLGALAWLGALNLGLLYMVVWIYKMVSAAWEKRLDQVLETNLEYVKTLTAEHNRQVHFLATARREGFSFQPEDDKFDVYVINSEDEALREEELEARRLALIGDE